MKSCPGIGLVGLDVTSNQKRTFYPYPAITQGNDAQDTYCNKTRYLLTPADIDIPSGGPFVFISKDGRMITCAPNKCVRDLLRQRFLTALMTKSTQGNLSTTKGHIYMHTMDIKAFTSCAIPPDLERFLLAEDDAQKTDLS